MQHKRFPRQLGHFFLFAWNFDFSHIVEDIDGVSDDHPHDALGERIIFERGSPGKHVFENNSDLTLSIVTCHKQHSFDLLAKAVADCVILVFSVRNSPFENLANKGSSHWALLLNSHPEEVLGILQQFVEVFVFSCNIEAFKNLWEVFHELNQARNVLQMLFKQIFLIF